MTHLTTADLLAEMQTAAAARHIDQDFETFMALGAKVLELAAEIERRTAAWYVATGRAIPSWIAAEYGLPADVHIEIAPEGDDVVIDGMTDANGNWFDVDDALALEIVERVEDLHREEPAIA